MKVIFQYIALIFMALLSVFTSKAQQYDEDTIKNIIAQNWNSIDLEEMPHFNVDSLVSAVEARDDTSNGKYQYAHKILVNLFPGNTGNWITITGIGKIWCLRIKSDSAMTLDINFSNFYLPKGTNLWVYDKNLDLLNSPLTFHNNQIHGQYVLTFLQGEEVGLVYFQPDSVTEPYGLEIDAVYHGFRDPFAIINGGNRSPLLACQDNVYCTPYIPPFEVIDNGVRAVFMYRNELGELCTGCMLNTKNTTLEAIFLTARHCIHEGGSGQGPLLNLNSMKFFFNFSSNGCGGPVFTKERYEHPVQGATLIAQSNTFIGGDQALLKISQLPPPHFKTYYAGWSAALLPTFSTILSGIHHSATEHKQISRRVGIISINIFGKIDIFWDNGVTESGASGSPLFKKNGRVIGALSGGVSGCIISGPDFYGKFRKFYNAHLNARQALGGTLFSNTNSGREILCYGGNLELGGFTNSEINYWPAGDYQPENHITLKAEGDIIAGVGNGLILKNGSHFTFQAGGTFIEMVPGFDVEVGAEWETILGVPCTPGPQKWSGEEEDETTAFEEEETTETLPIEAGITIHPNPTSGEFTIQVTGDAGQGTSEVYIYDLFGRLIYKSEIVNLPAGALAQAGLKSKIVNISQHPKGIYLVKVLSGEEIYIKKLVHN